MSKPIVVIWQNGVNLFQDNTCTTHAAGRSLRHVSPQIAYNKTIALKLHPETSETCMLR